MRQSRWCCSPRQIEPRRSQSAPCSNGAAVLVLFMVESGSNVNITRGRDLFTHHCIIIETKFSLFFFFFCGMMPIFSIIIFLLQELSILYTVKELCISLLFLLFVLLVCFLLGICATSIYCSITFDVLHFATRRAFGCSSMQVHTQLLLISCCTYICACTYVYIHLSVVCSR